MKPPSSGTTEVFLLAENRLLREALTRILTKTGDLQVVGAAPLSAQTLGQIAAARPAVLVLDSFSVVLSHLEFIREVHAALPEVKVLMIGMEPDEECFLRAVREGAAGYILNDASATEVVAGIRAVAGGVAVCPPWLCRALFRQIARSGRQAPGPLPRQRSGLTRREQQLVSLIGRGLTNKQIAGDLGLSEQTVKNHVHRMLRKLGANDRLSAVEFCRAQGLSL